MQSPIHALIIAVAVFAAASATADDTRGGNTMSDYDAISATINDYFEGLKSADRARLERAFAVNAGHMKGYLKGKDGSYTLTSRPMDEVIDDWAARDQSPDMQGKILSVNIYSDVAATVLFDFNGIFVDAFQLAKVNGEWRIINKFYIDQ